MEQPYFDSQPTAGTSFDIFSEIQSLVQRLAELEKDLHQLVRGQVDAVIDPESGHIILLRQAQQALHSNERQLRALFESALDAILIADDDGRYVDANPAACELFGVSREKLIGRYVRDFTAPDFEVDQIWERFKQQDQLQRGIFRVRRPDGTIREAEYSASANFLPGRHLSVLRDVTQRRQTEIALRRSEERFRSLIEYSEDVILLLNAEGMITYASPSIQRILGADPVGLLNRPALFAVHPEDAAQAAWMLADVLRKPGNVVSGQFRVGHAHSYPVWIEGTCNNLLHVDTVNAVVVTFRDITMRRQTESALIETTTTLQTMIQSSPLPIIAIDQEHKVTTWNPAAERVFGWTAQEVIGKPLPYIPAEHTEEFTARMDLLFAQRKFSMYEGQRLRRDGAIIDVSVAAAPVLNGADAVIGGMAIVSDITEAKQAERIQDAVAQMASALRSAATSKEMLTVLLDQSILHVNAQGGRVILYAEDGETITHSLRRGDWPQHQAFNNPSLLLAVRSLRRYLVSQDIHVDPRFGPDLPTSAPVAQVYMPLVVDDEAIGIMQLGRALAFSEAEIRLLQAITDIAASSIQRAQLYEEVQVALQRSNALYAVAQHLISTEALPKLLSSVIDGVVAILNADWVHLYILDPDNLQSVDQLGRGNLDHVAQLSAFNELMGRITQKVVQHREGLILPQPLEKHLAALRPAEYAQLGIGSIMMTPLLYHEQILGVLLAVNRAGAADFSLQDLTVLSAFANQASVALANARFFHQVQEQAEQLRRVMDAVADGLVLLDVEQRILLANPAATAILARFGRVSDEQQLMMFGGLPIDTLLARPGQGRSIHEVETQTPTPAVFEVMSHVTGSTAEVEGWLLVLRDVTEERENRQRAMQQGQLAAVGQLAAGIAHDFNNIMGAIVIYSQLMKNTVNLTGKNRERLDVIHQQAQYAAELVRQLLDFSRSSVLERRTLNAVSFCKELVKLLERILPETIELTFTAAKPDYRVSLDPARFQQALINMAVNARDAMPNGGVLRLHLEDLHFDTHEKPPLAEMTAGTWLCIEISDSGSGIPHSVLSRIFDPFFSTKERGKGSGLGLAQVYGIVQQHNGFIKVYSIVGEGTTFAIYLPLVEEVESPNQEPNMATIEPARHRCVLVVEDNVATRDALVDFLDINGYRVLTAKDGQDALHTFTQGEHTIDLVLSDMIMPRLGGLELFHALREIKPDVKMILMTGYPLQEDGRQLLEKGGIAWLQKPFEVEALIAMMQKLW